MLIFISCQVWWKYISIVLNSSEIFIVKWIENVFGYENKNVYKSNILCLQTYRTTWSYKIIVPYSCDCIMKRLTFSLYFGAFVVTGTSLWSIIFLNTKFKLPGTDSQLSVFFVQTVPLCQSKKLRSVGFGRSNLRPSNTARQFVCSGTFWLQSRRLFS